MEDAKIVTESIAKVGQLEMGFNLLADQSLKNTGKIAKLSRKLSGRTLVAAVGVCAITAFGAFVIDEHARRLERLEKLAGISGDSNKEESK